MFTVDQIREILSIVDYHQSFLIMQVLGKDSLDDFDKYILRSNGVDIDKIEAGVPTYYQSLMWGRLSAMLQEKDAKDIKYDDFLKHIKQGQYIPLSKREQAEYEAAKQKTYTHLKGLGIKVKGDVSNILFNEDDKLREERRKAVKEEIERGTLERKSLKSIVSDIGHRTEVWNHDWARIIETECNDIFQQGRESVIREQEGDDARVFKDTFSGACRHCIRLHLTNGIGSKPIVFKLSELSANGTNVGRKVADWKPVIGSVHPHCRCHLRKIPKGYEWDEEKGKFSLKQKEIKERVKRTRKIPIQIGDVTKYV